MSDKIFNREEKGAENSNGIFKVFIRGPDPRLLTWISVMFLLFFLSQKNLFFAIFDTRLLDFLWFTNNINL